ncbi:hypothetical protein IIC38_02160 [candidate division KSB1 bacterium]|nr:hypothetical protein [candidate division KSB1 bacterium]
MRKSNSIWVLIAFAAGIQIPRIRLLSSLPYLLGCHGREPGRIREAFEGGWNHIRSIC